MSEVRLGDLNALRDTWDNMGGGEEEFVDTIRQRIDAAPTIDTDVPEDVRGHIVWKKRKQWVPKAGIENGKIVDFGHYVDDKAPYCSECGKRLDDNFMRFCPNCGCRMGAEDIS